MRNGISWYFSVTCCFVVPEGRFGVIPSILQRSDCREARESLKPDWPAPNRVFETFGLQGLIELRRRSRRRHGNTDLRRPPLTPPGARSACASVHELRFRIEERA